MCTRISDQATPNILNASKSEPFSSTPTSPPSSPKTVYTTGDREHLHFFYNVEFLKTLSSVQVPRKLRVEELESVIRDKDAQIERLKHLIVQLQDLIVEERSIELDRLKEIMGETEDSKLLDIHSNSNFMLSPQRALGDPTFPSGELIGVFL